MPNDHIARIDAALERIARGQRHVQATIEKQQKRLEENAELIAQAREVLARSIR